MIPAIDRGFLESVATNLVRINSINPSLVAGAPGEAEVAAYVARTMEQIGLVVQRHEPQKGRVSVVGRLRGGAGRSLMLNAHSDTVGIEQMPQPFDAVVRHGRLYGRGAFDMKGSLAAQIAAAKALVDGKVALQGELLVAAVADEEFASIGTADLLARYQPDGAIVTEPTSLQLCLAHKGFAWIEVETHGRAAHGSRYELGIDANMHMGRVLAELEHLRLALLARAPHPLVGPPSLHAALLRGGTEMSMYAASCRLGIERRTIPGETTEQVVSEIEEIVARLSRADAAFSGSVELMIAREPFEVDAGAEIVRAVAKAAAGVLGAPPPMIGDTPWMDSALLAAAGVETVIIGPEGAGAHADEEWVSLDSLAALAAILVAAAIDYCGLASPAE